jgi:hypothetical protein
MDEAFPCLCTQINQDIPYWLYKEDLEVCQDGILIPLSQHAYEEGHKICWKEVKVLQIEPNTTYRKHKESAHDWLLIRSVNPGWTSLPSGLPLLQQKSENYNSIQRRLGVKAVFLCWYHTGNLSL